MAHSPRALGLAALCVAALVAPAQAQTLQFLGEQIISNSATVGGTTVGGLSGLDYDATTNTYVSNSDDQVAPRFYTLTANITPTSFTGVNITGVTNLTRTPAFASGNNDFENIRLSQDRQSVYITSEGNANTGLGPSIFQFNRSTGAFISETAAPSQFTPTGLSGITFNLGFEAQAFTDSTFSKYLAVNEGPLIQDVNFAGLQPGTTNSAAVFNIPEPVRMVRYDTLTGVAEAQFVYIADALTEPVPITGTTFGVQGVVDILAVGNGNFFALERSFTVGGTAGGGTGYTIKLYQFALTGATDVSGLNSLNGQAYTPVSKQLVMDFSTVRDANNNPLTLDNIEGMSFGPDLGDGKRALLFVSDNNFAGAQKTQFLAFALTIAPEPGTFALLGLGVLAMVARARRRR